MLTNDKIWLAARTRRNQERTVKTRLEQIGVEHFTPFRKEFRRRKNRTVELSVPVIPNIVFIHADYATCLDAANNHGIRISFIRAIDGKGLLVVPQKQMDDFQLICRSDTDYRMRRDEVPANGDRVLVVRGPLRGVEGELIRTGGNNGRVLMRLDGIASFELTVASRDIRKM